MKHLNGFRTLNRTKSHRRALYRNMIEALFTHERIKTTDIKAKELRRVAEKIITKAKDKTLHNIRVVNKLIKDEKVLMKLFNEIAPRYVERNGGYIRIIKLGLRKGDNALLSYIELVEETAPKSAKKKKSVKKTTADKAPVSKKADKVEAEKTEVIETPAEDNKAAE